MIERELSKQHSISSISIQDQEKDPKEKIIKIKYENNSKSEIKIVDNSSVKSSSSEQALSETKNLYIDKVTPFKSSQKITNLSPN